MHLISERVVKVTIVGKKKESFNDWEGGGYNDSVPG